MANLLPWQQPEIIQHTQRLLRSFEHWTGRSLLIPSDNTPEAIARELFEAPFVVVSHATQSDPIFNYGNQTALRLWELDWGTFIQTPSRKTAEPEAQQARAQLLARARANGFIDDYQGIRISSTGRRFWIRDVILWDVLDEQDCHCGQAATFNYWEFIRET